MINYTAWTGRQDDETPTGDATDFLEKLPSTRRIENEGKPLQHGGLEGYQGNDVGLKTMRFERLYVPIANSHGYQDGKPEPGQTPIQVQTSLLGLCRARQKAFHAFLSMRYS